MLMNFLKMGAFGLGIAAATFCAGCHRWVGIHVRLPLVYVIKDEPPPAFEDEEPRGDMKIRVMTKTETRTVETIEDGTRVTVVRDGDEYIFEKTIEGAFFITVTKKGAEPETREYADQAAFKKDQPEWHKIFEGEGFTLRITPAAPPAKQPGRGPDADDFGGDEELQELQELLGEIERFNRNDPISPRPPREPAAGELTQDELKDLSRRASERLERVMERLERRAKDARELPDANERFEEEADIARARFAASLQALERTLADRLAQIREAGKAHEAALDDLQDRIRDKFADLRDEVAKGDQAERDKALEAARKFFDKFEEELNGWAAKLGVKFGECRLKDIVGDAKEELLKRIEKLKQDGGEDHREALKQLADRVKDDFSALLDRLKDAKGDKLEELKREARTLGLKFTLELDAVAKRIIRGIKIQRAQPADVVGGVRVEKLGELLKAQLDIDHGLSVSEVTDSKGVLAQAGVKTHDVLLTVDGEKVRDRDGLARLLDGVKPGAEFTLKVVREGKEKELKGVR